MRVRQVDPACGLIDLFGPCSNDAKCYVTKQYDESPCNYYKPECTKLDKIFSDEEAIELHLGAVKSGIDFTKIAKDPFDVKKFLWAQQNDNAAIYTCDSNLLEICGKHGIPRHCFKAALKELDLWFDGAILSGKEYNIEVLSQSDDPYMNFGIDKKCISHCQNSPCVCFSGGS